jgi:UDP-3-O-[3-hydroxymyristoyl] glucosamine N-acyltransferase
MAEMTVSELATRLGGQHTGDGAKVIRGVSTLEAARADEVAFLANPKYEKQMATTAAGAVIVGLDYAGAGATLIRCRDPYFAFREAMVAFFGFRKHPFSGIDARANIDASARIGANAAISPFVTIAPDCQVGDNVVIYPGVYVGAGCRIGNDCTLYPNVTLYDGTILHNRVAVHANSCIGQDGFGYATHKCADGVVRHDKIPQAGWVELEDDVEIGACAAIERAAMGPTTIGAGTKLWDLVAIGHGTQIGRHCLLAPQSGIAGSVKVGDYCVFAGQSGVVNHVHINDGVKVGAQSGVTKDVAPGQIVVGSPADDIGRTKRILATYANLPEMRSALKKLTQEVEELKKKLDEA